MKKYIKAQNNFHERFGEVLNHRGFLTEQIDTLNDDTTSNYGSHHMTSIGEKQWKELHREEITNDNINRQKQDRQALAERNDDMARAC